MLIPCLVLAQTLKELNNEDKYQLRVEQVHVDESSGEITVIGWGFDGAGLRLGSPLGPSLPIISRTNTEMVVQIPGNLGPGNYLVNVRNRQIKKNAYNTYFEITLGATGPAGPPGPPGPANGSLFRVLDNQDVEIGDYVGIYSNSTGTPGTPGDQKRPSLLVLFEWGSDSYILPVFGSGFGATSRIAWSQPGCVGDAYLSAGDNRLDFSFDGLFGSNLPYVAANEDRSLLVIDGALAPASLESELVITGECFEYGSPDIQDAFPLLEVVKLGTVFETPFRIETN